MIKIGIIPRKNDELHRYVYSQFLIDEMRFYSILPVFLFDKEQFCECDGFILAGGLDIDPIRYHQKVHPKTVIDSFDIEAFEFSLVHYCHQNHLPLLGICKGMQIINVYFGGSLHQHIEHHQALWHEVICAHHFSYEHLLIYSDHHQCIDKLANGFHVFAKDQNGIIEGIHKDQIIAVQWHPELENHSPLLSSFFQSVTAYKVDQDQNR